MGDDRFDDIAASFEATYIAPWQIMDAQPNSVFVVVDVLRAFTTAAVAFDRGANKIVLTATIEAALDCRAKLRGSLLMGEESGLCVDGFDLSNSPAEMLGADLAGRTIVMKSSHGTGCVISAMMTSPRAVYCASLVCGRATRRLLQQLKSPARFVISGRRRIGDPLYGDDDLAAAEYIACHCTAAVAASRIGASPSAAKFEQGRGDGISRSDLAISACADLFAFGMEVREGDAGPEIRAIDVR